MTRYTTWLIVVVALLTIIGLWLTKQPSDLTAAPDYESSSNCKRGELLIPNGRGLIASVRRTACAPPFAPDDIDYFVFVHKADERDKNDNLVFHYQPDNYGPLPVLTPRVGWSNATTLHIAMSVAPHALTQLKRLGSVQIAYNFGATEWKANVAEVSTHIATAHILAVPSWAKLKSGEKVYFGSDPVGTNTTLTVCPSVAAYRLITIRTTSTYSDATIGSGRCMRAKRGMAAIVEAVIPSVIGDWYYPAPVVRVKASAGRWTGVTSAIGLQPDIPVGTNVTMTRKEFPVTLDRCQDNCAETIPSDRLEIPGTVQVRVLRYDPVSRVFDSIYVKVLNGVYTGRAGWMQLSYMRSADSLYSNLYGLDYSPVPELVPTAL